MAQAENKTHRKTISILLATIIVAGIGVWLVMARQPQIKRVILISIDTCRADHLSCYGFDRATTPQIDAIAGEGILFANAHTPVPLTLPAHCSMLTGTYPIYHKVHANLDYKLGDSHNTLAEILQVQGYDTAAVVSSVVMHHDVGIGQGFDQYFDGPERTFGAFEQVGQETTRQAIEFLQQQRQQPFFLFLHYFDPHTEYTPPEPYATEYADDLYSGEIAYTDMCIGQVIDQLKSMGLYESTLIIITSDHGESLGEHNESTHGYYIYQSSIHVPLIIRAPGMKRMQRIDQLVCLVDIVPTILGYLDLPIPAHIQGFDLSGNSPGNLPELQNRDIYYESILPARNFDCNPLWGILHDKWSYIHTIRAELYDRQADPRQLNNLAEENIQRTRAMHQRLEEMKEQWSSQDGDNQIELDPLTRKQLESLGYLGGAIISDDQEFDISKTRSQRFHPMLRILSKSLEIY